MDCCGLSSTGFKLQDIDANDIIADNITILSNWNVSGTTNLNNSLKVQGVNILNSIDNLNNIINNDSSTINVNASNRIIFNVNNIQLIKINTTGSSIHIMIKMNIILNITRLYSIYWIWRENSKMPGESIELFLLSFYNKWYYHQKIVTWIYISYI